MIPQYPQHPQNTIILVHHLRCSPFQGSPISGVHHLRCSPSQVFTISGVHHLKCSPSQMFTISGVHHFRCSPSQVSTISGVHHLRCSPFQVFTILTFIINGKVGDIANVSLGILLRVLGPALDKFPLGVHQAHLILSDPDVV